MCFLVQNRSFFFCNVLIWTGKEEEYLPPPKNEINLEKKKNICHDQKTRKSSREKPSSKIEHFVTFPLFPWKNTS
jgi:hypothetical protein